MGTKKRKAPEKPAGRDATGTKSGEKAPDQRRAGAEKPGDARVAKKRKGLKTQEEKVYALNPQPSTLNPTGREGLSICLPAAVCPCSCLSCPVARACVHMAAHSLARALRMLLVAESAGMFIRNRTLGLQK